MLRTALRLGTLPLLAGWIVLGGEGIPFWQWFAIVLLGPFICGILLASFWQLKRDPVEGAVPVWARKLAPWVWAVSVVVILSVPLTSWPLRYSFKRSQPQLEQLLVKAKTGETIAWPQSAGSFVILALDIEEEKSRFYLSREDGEPPITLVHASFPQSPDKKPSLPKRNSVVILGENWYYSEPFD